MSENEIVLQGGNVTAVVRIGETVRRQLKPMSSTIHRLLLHLEEMKFDGAPRFLGIDEKQREILSFVSGETDSGQYPFLKPYMRSDEALTEMAWLLRKYHDATASFPREEKDEWMMAYPGKQHAEVICHNDAAPYNVVFRNGSPAALIDFDTACPGPRIWDIAYALYTFVPLTGSVPTFEGKFVPYDRTVHADQRRRRIQLFFEGYGIPQPDNFLEQVEDRLGALCDTLVTRAANGDEAFARMVEEGHLEHYRREIEFVRSFGKEWI